MLRFIKVSYRNILSVGQVPIEIELDEPGSYLIIGRNGAGKSLIGEAITYALFGRPYRNINRPQLVNSVNKRDMLVELDFETRGRLYRIRRGIKPTVFEVYENGKLLNQDAASRDYQEDLEKKILHMNFSAWKQIAMLGSTAYVPFMELTRDKRRLMIEELLDTQIYSVMSRMNSKRASESKSRLDLIAVQMTAADDKIKIIRSNVARFVQSNEEMIASRQERLAEFETKWQEASEALKTVNDELDSLQTAYDELHASVMERNTKANSLRSSIQGKQRTLNKEISFFNDNEHCPTCAQGITEEYRCEAIAKKKEVLVELDDVLENLNQRVVAINKAQAKLEADNVEISKLNHERIELQTTIRHTTSSIESLQKEIQQLTEQKQSYQQDEKAVADLQKELKELRSEKNKILSNAEMFRAAQFLLKDSGIKAQQVAKYIPIINKFINKYLAAMDFFIQFELNENFEEVILSRYRDDFTYNSFSQGEKFRIDLALLLTWRAVAKIRNSCATNLLFLDEIFDSSLDNSGVEEFMKLIDMLAGEGTTVMVVSHRGDVLADKFNNILRFEKVKSFTQMVES